MKIHSGFLVLPAFAFLAFSFNFHALWIIYDVIALIALIYFYDATKCRIPTLALILTLSTITYLLTMAGLRGHIFVGILSAWDTLKHVIYLTLLVQVSGSRFSSRSVDATRNMYHLVAVTFAIQVMAVLIQYSNGVFFDDIAGTFGDGGSHAIGYVSLLFLTAAIAMRKGKLIIVFGIVAAMLMNLASENIGFYLLLALVLAGVAVTHRLDARTFIGFIAVAMAGYFVLDVALYHDKPFYVSAFERVFEMVDISADRTESVGRGWALMLALDTGGWFGYGPGAFSDIYTLNGYGFNEQIHLNINETSHVIAESGIVGFVMVIGTYVSTVVKLFSRTSTKLFAIALLVACAQYSLVFMNEGHA